MFLIYPIQQHFVSSIFIIIVESISSIHVHVHIHTHTHIHLIIESTIIETHVHLKSCIGSVSFVRVERNVHLWSRNVHIHVHSGHAEVHIHLCVIVIVEVIIPTDLDIHVRRRDVHIHVHSWYTHLDVCRRNKVRLLSVHLNVHLWSQINLGSIHLNVHLRRCNVWDEWRCHIDIERNRNLGSFNVKLLICECEGFDFKHLRIPVWWSCNDTIIHGREGHY